MNKLLLHGLSVLAALFISLPLFAQTASSVPSASLEMASIPDIQSLPTNKPISEIWLDGRVSFVGGLITTSQQQYEYAQSHGLTIANSRNFPELVSSGSLQRLEGPNLRIKSGGVVPYVLPQTKYFILGLAFDYGQAGCGDLVITDALRFSDGNMPSAASSFSVHPRGMAVDVRTNGITEYCKKWLNDYLTVRENRMSVDVTYEQWKTVRGRKVPNPHYHLVVPLAPVIPPVSVTAPLTDQSN